MTLTTNLVTLTTNLVTLTSILLALTPNLGMEYVEEALADEIRVGKVENVADWPEDKIQFICLSFWLSIYLYLSIYLSVCLHI